VAEHRRILALAAKRSLELFDALQEGGNVLVPRKGCGLRDVKFSVRRLSLMKARSSGC
jgi:hypothetical protein